VIVIAVEIYAHNVTVKFITPAAFAYNFIWFIVECADGDINILVVIEDFELRRLGRFCSFPGNPLCEIAFPLAGLPALIVQHSIDYGFFASEPNGGIYSRRPFKRRMGRVVRNSTGKSI
jgi:hypothetical protein